METWRICATCGVENSVDPEVCAICADERQYLPPGGQRWTTLAERAAEGCHLEIADLEPDLFGLTARPKADIGQTALLVRTPGGNLLWDVPGYLDVEAVVAVQRLGGISAIMASHPHMYGVQREWARAFGSTVWVADKDRRWVRRDGPELGGWSDPFEVVPGIVASQPGGHFPGSAVALWRAGAGGRGVLLSGDTVAAVPAEGWVTFMRSYPNKLPLSAAVVERVAAAVTALEFDRLYDNFGGIVGSDANAAVRRSAQRYIGWVPVTTTPRPDRRQPAHGHHGAVKTESPAPRDPRLDPFRDAVLELSRRGEAQGYLTSRIVPMRTFPVFWEWQEWMWYRVHWLDGHHERMRDDHGPSWDVVSQLEKGRFVLDDLAGRTFDVRPVQGAERDALWARYGPPA